MLLNTFISLILGLLVLPCVFSEVENNIVSHNVSITHRGEEQVTQLTLQEVKDKTDNPSHYFMDVESVICLKKLCKVVPVQLHWNTLGQYDHYELKDGVTLEKYEGDAFEPKDYKKLQRILANKDSPFKDLYLEEIITVEYAVDSDELDALSGATALVIDEEENIDGAVLTCFTLWHWVHGPVVNVIKDITGKYTSQRSLLDFLEKGGEYQILAFKELSKRKVFNSKVEEIIYHNLSKWTIYEVKQALKYLETIEPSYSNRILNKLFEFGSPQKRKIILQSIFRILQLFKGEEAKGLLSIFSELNSYEEFNLFVNFVESNEIKNQEIYKELIGQLDIQDFLISRRIYWFLKNQNLSIEQRELLFQFYENNKDRL